MKIKFSTNILLVLTGLCQILTGVGLATVELDFFEELHSIAGFAMSVLICLHIYLNRNWFRRYVFKTV